MLFRRAARFHPARLVIPAVAFALLAPSIAAADRRAFTRTYEYMTMPKGETEVELYTTQSRATFDDSSPQKFVFQLELEHGITERWDVSLYHVFEQTTGAGTMTDPGQPLHLSELKLRTRYRFAERGELAVDPEAYLEAVKSFGASEYEAEAKAIVARDFGLVTVAANPVFAVKFGSDVVETEVEVGWAAGVTYEVSPALKLGAETWGGFDLDAPGDAAASAGPALSWAPSQSLWIATTVGFGLNDQADSFSVRGLIGLHL